MSYERDQFQSFVTSASLATALAPYITSQSVSAAIAGISLGAYVTSNSLSAAVATDVLTVRGAASVSATLSAGAVTVATRPVGAVLLGTTSGTNRTSLAFSGSWSDFAILELQALIFQTNTGTLPVSIFTDGGGTAILSKALDGSIGGSANVAFDVRVFGGDGQSHKLLQTRGVSSGSGDTFGVTATANTGFINCLRVSISVTASYAFAALYGWRKA